jgi:hypothetical protein
MRNQIESAAAARRARPAKVLRQAAPGLPGFFTTPESE